MLMFKVALSPMGKIPVVVQEDFDRMDSLDPRVGIYCPSIFRSCVAEHLAIPKMFLRQIVLVHPYILLGQKKHTF